MLNLIKRILILSVMILTVFLLAACRVVTPELPVIHTATIVPSIKPSTPSITPSPFLIATPTPYFCNIMQDQGEIEVMSGLLFTALGPRGPVDFNRILIEQNLAWADFRQENQGEMRSAGIIFHETSFGPEWGTGVNPAVILVTYGVERNWELPINGDLVSEVENIRATLRQHESDWILEKIDQSQYPTIANAATYALYRYFNDDISKLEDWCHTYVQVYDESPLIPNTSLTCTIMNEQFYVLSDDVIFAWEITEEEIDTALEDNFPEWAVYRQKVEWEEDPIKMGKIVLNASWQERFVINPAIVIVTLGENFYWQIPSNKDLYLESVSVNERLNHFWFEWNHPENEHIRSRYPDISNASTYALYMFFDQDMNRLVSWCSTYQRFFGMSEKK